MKCEWCGKKLKKVTGYAEEEIQHHECGKAKWRKVYETRIGGSDGELSFRVMGSDYTKEVELVRDGADYLLRVWAKTENPNNFKAQNNYHETQQ